MKRHQSFRRFLDRSFGRLADAPPSSADSGWDRVVERMREEPDGASKSAQVALDSARAIHPAGMRRHSWTLAAAAVVVFAVILSWAFWSRSASVVAKGLDEGLLRVIDGKPQSLEILESIKAGEIIRSNGGPGGTLVLTDGSRIEMRSHTELFLEAATDGIRIVLNNGSVIVNAAKQENGRHLYVQTKDVTVSVVGTVFLVNAEEEGSRVVVIEGKVHVKQREGERNLIQGEQVVTNPRMELLPVTSEIVRSPKAEARVAQLEQNAAQVTAAASPSQPPTRPVDTPKWDVISIRPCGNPATMPGVRAGAMGTSPGELRVTCLAVRYLLLDAYVVWREEGMRFREDFPILGAPSWVSSELYTITARIAGKREDLPADWQMKGPMLQMLLEERFNLKMRHEIREDNVYELRVGDGGFKPQPLSEAECERRKAAWDGATKPEREAMMMKPGEDPIFKLGCGATGIGGGPPGTKKIRQSGIGIAEFIRNLGLDRIVLDKTGLEGRYDIVLTYGIANSPMREPKVFPPGVVGGDSIFVALEKQLGLKLVPTKGPRSFYFIEHIDPPTPN
jgi:uncharacterized protein (TIGR03435 family)